MVNRVKRPDMKEAENVVFSKIRCAVELHDRFSGHILSDRGMISLLEEYRKQVRKSRLLMEELGLPAVCTHCAVRLPGGGCCGEAIAGWYDPLTLLMNLFYGIEFPKESFYPDSCLFLGKDGCVLVARYHFCVNYLCKRITGSLSQRALSRLMSQSGRELFTAWRLEGMLWEFLRSKGVPHDCLD